MSFLTVLLVVIGVACLVVSGLAAWLLWTLGPDDRTDRERTLDSEKW